MTKVEFLDALERELRRKHVADAEEICSEYEQHFAFKLADGYTQEEIAARLGDPSAIATQFAPVPVATNTTRKTLTAVGLCVADLVAACFFALLFAWEIVMAVLSLACAVLAVSLLTDTGFYVRFAPMPYWCGAVFGLALIALAVFAAVGCVYFFAFVRQLLRAYRRFHHNSIACTSSGAVLPPLALHPQLTPKTNRRVRTVALVSLALFAACFMLGMIASMLSAGAPAFWHTWGWFGYTPA